MNTQDYKKVTLSTMAEGAVEQLFNRELQGVLKNIDDINTSATAAREINIKLKLKPNTSRDNCELTIQCSSKKAPVKDVATSFHLSVGTSGFEAYEKVERELEDNVTTFAR